MPSAVKVESSSVRSSGAPGRSSVRNPVAHEVHVVATGARPGTDPSQRELFTESTSTVLVFKNGAVIRLSAAVATGQLVFLTHQESKREVVAQVKSKRNFKPTSCYVELEFTEAAPGFWGIEFPEEGSQPAPANSHQAEAVELVQQAEVTSESRKNRSTAPSAGEVERLKREVEGLREQLHSLKQSQAEASNANMPPAAPESAAAPEPGPVLAEQAPIPDPETAKAAASPEPKHNSEVLASSSNPGKEASQETTKRTALRDSPPRQPSLLSPERVEKSRKSRGPSRTLLAALAIALVLASSGAAYYLHWLPLPKLFSQAPRAKATFAATPAPASSTQKTQPVGTIASTNNLSAAHPAATPAISETPASDDAPPANAPETSSTAAPTAASARAPDSHDDSVPSGDPAASAIAAGKPASPVASAKHLQPRHGNKETASSVASSTSLEIADIVPPKLLHSVRPVPPPDAVHDFVTGNVKIDALVDSSGQVKSVSVLAGPESLRSAAVEAVKQYKYAPATRNSTPVSAHVTVSVQFWYEP